MSLPILFYKRERSVIAAVLDQRLLKAILQVRVKKTDYSVSHHCFPLFKSPVKTRWSLTFLANISAISGKDSQNLA